MFTVSPRWNPNDTLFRARITVNPPRKSARKRRGESSHCTVSCIPRSFLLSIYSPLILTMVACWALVVSNISLIVFTILLLGLGIILVFGIRTLIKQFVSCLHFFINWIFNHTEISCCSSARKIRMRAHNLPRQRTTAKERDRRDYVPLMDRPI